MTDFTDNPTFYRSIPTLIEIGNPLSGIPVGAYSPIEISLPGGFATTIRLATDAMTVSLPAEFEDLAGVTPA